MVYVWINPPLPLSTEELDYVFALPYARAPHPAHGSTRIPAWEMIRFSVLVQGLFLQFCWMWSWKNEAYNTVVWDRLGKSASSLP